MPNPTTAQRPFFEVVSRALTQWEWLDLVEILPQPEHHVVNAEDQESADELENEDAASS